MIWNQWYTACASSRVGAAPRAVRVLDRDLVVWRDASGAARALLDRCCHRGYKLSLGKVTEGQLECGLHGWRYNGEGRCVDVPSLPSGTCPPADFQVPSFECVENDGYVWVWMGRDGVLPRCKPSIPGFEGRSWLQGNMDMRCSAERGVEINLDGAHVYYVHPSHPATVAFRASEAALCDAQQELRITDRGLVVFSPPVESAAEPVPESASHIVFELPNSVRFTNPFGARILLMFFVPTGLGSCRLEYMMSRPPGGPRIVWIDQEHEIFRQDREVLEVIQAVSGGAVLERSVEADAVALAARRIMRLAASGKWDRGRAALEETRRIIEARRVDAPMLIGR